MAFPVIDPIYVEMTQQI